ncbi:Flavodoxin reductase family protein [Cupriavidus taiwanensis]|uniref:Flavodoxin reductase family protein n=1 Tax=Cupriavidus taiwanensis TaxID=164546 RepID=A0A375CSD4_9BURK|nr:Rieske 2Fe-2S domain-containing protein [Cupriavidus taiwanensis]SOY78120.1 Flavodoxin reductase family protein [Cupriavidus taiwanensis]
MNTREQRWYPVARADDVPMRHVFQGQLHGIELALWRADDGTVNAWENRCPHRSVRFSLGANTGERLRCQYHGWQYRSGDGRCTHIPAASGATPPASLCARTFAAAEAGGYVWVNLAADAAAPFAAAGTALPLALRSLVFHAGIEAVADALARYAGYDDRAVPGSATLVRRDNQVAQIDLSWRAGAHERQVRFWLQPADTGKTIVHSTASGCGMAPDAALRWHNRMLTALRREVEPNAARTGSTGAAASVAQPRIIAIVPKPAAARSNTHAVTVAARWMTAQDIVAFRLAPSAGFPLNFEPGAHIDVHTPAGPVRQYSLVNAPGERDGLVIGVKLEPQSRGGSRSMHEALQVGDRLTVSAPKNNFRLAPAAGGLLIAGGIGITPILAMAAALQTARLPCALHYFTRGEAHVAFGERLAALDHLRRHLDLTAQATREAVEQALETTPDDRHIYVCGPRPLIDLVRERAAIRGIAEARVHAELFANDVSHHADQPFRVRLDKRGTEFLVPAGVTLAEALKAQGIALDTSCEQGVCGTCLTDVVDGEPEHRDVYLSAAEKQGNRCLLPCVSRSRSGLLVLDL